MKKLTRVFKRALVNVAIAALQGWQAKSLPVIRSLPRELLFKNPQICDREHYHPFHLGSWQKKTRQEKKKKENTKLISTQRMKEWLIRWLFWIRSSHSQASEEILLWASVLHRLDTSEVWNPAQRCKKKKKIWEQILHRLRSFVWLFNVFTLFNIKK